MPLPELRGAFTYYVEVVGESVRLLESPSGPIVDLGTPPDTETRHFLTPAGPLQSGVNSGPLKSFESLPFTGAEIDPATNTIHLGPDHGLANGDAIVYSTSGTITILAGDDITIEPGAQLDAGTSIFIRGDYEDADPGFGSRIEIAGHLAAQDVFIHGGGDNDVIDFHPQSMVGQAQLFGELGNDEIYGADLDQSAGGLLGDIILGGPGNDLIDARKGADIVFGGDGDDTIRGGNGDDYVAGEYGNDLIDGQLGDDILFGGVGVFGASSIDRQSPAEFVVPSQWLIAEASHPTGVTAAQLGFDQLMPVIVADASVEGNFGDGQDTVRGSSGRDWLFGGGDSDDLDGEEGGDYVDGGAGNDVLRGNSGNDIVRGGANNDVLHGDADIDLLLGDSGSDQLFGDRGDASGSQLGQRLFGGTGIDFLYAYADTNLSSQFNLSGDQLFGGSDGDWLYGNIRREVLVGESGNDTIVGDFLAGPDYAENLNASTFGADDTLRGGSGEDQLFGGGGRDNLRGGADQDRLEGQDGRDLLYGDGGIDMLVLDTHSTYTEFGDRFDGHFGTGDVESGPDDHATDLMLVEGSTADDVIHLREEAAIISNDASPVDPVIGLATTIDFVLNGSLSATIAVSVNDYGSMQGLADAINVAIQTEGTLDGNVKAIAFGEQQIAFVTLGLGRQAVLEVAGGTNLSELGLSAGVTSTDYLVADLRIDQGSEKTFLASWRHADGTPLVEQFRIAGLSGNDSIEFATGRNRIDVSELVSRSTDFVAVIDGGPGNDILRGTDARDRLDGGSGSDLVYGFGGDDRIWGDSGDGDINDFDVLFAGQGNDDVLGGRGQNALFAWSMGPSSPLHLMDGATVVESDGLSTITGFAPVPQNGQLRQDVTFALGLGQLAPVSVTLNADDTYIPGAAGNNLNRDDLVLDLQNALNSAGLSAVTVGLTPDGRLTLSTDSDSLSIDNGQFGVFVDPAGNFHGDTRLDIDLDDAGALSAFTGRPIELTQNVSIETLSRISGLGIDAPDDADKIHFELASPATSSDAITIKQLKGAGALLAQLRNASGDVVITVSTAQQPEVELSLAGVPVGAYTLEISGSGVLPLSYEILPSVGAVGTIDLNLELVAEDTGLNRILGSSQRGDALFGGTGLDFLYGNGADSGETDSLFDRNGNAFETLDSGVAGEEWKEYAKGTEQVWYYGGTNLDDQISVDLVTEPDSLLQGRHLITRLTGNNGNFTFDAQVQLSFDGVDDAGNLVWNPADTVFGFDWLLGAEQPISIVSGTPLPDSLTQSPPFRLVVDAGTAQETHFDVQLSLDGISRNGNSADVFNAFNAALAAAGAGGVVRAEVTDDGRLRLRLLQGESIAIEIAPSERSFMRSLFGLRNGQRSRTLVSSLVDDAVISLRVYDADPVEIVVPRTHPDHGTSDNENFDDLLEDVNYWLGEAGLGEDVIAERLVAGDGEATDRLQFRLRDPQRVAESGSANRGRAPLETVDLNDVAENELHLSSGQQAVRVRTDAIDVNALLPPEDDFLAIIIDGLSGDDQITIGPTVTKSVWVTGGPATT